MQKLLTVINLYGCSGSRVKHGMTLGICCILSCFSYFASANNLRWVSAIPNTKIIHQLGMSFRKKQTIDSTTRSAVSHYQQYYHNIRVLGASITHLQARSKRHLAGHFLHGIVIPKSQLQQLNDPDSHTAALEQVVNTFKLAYGADYQITPHKTHLRIAAVKQQALPVFEIQFIAQKTHAPSIYYHAIVDAKNPVRIYKAWNDRQQFRDTGPGGNEHTGIYYYGKQGNPALHVERHDALCIMESPRVRLVNLNEQHQNDRGDNYYRSPYQYVCGSSERDADPFLGAYSPADDAYFFGHLITWVYEDWYDERPLPFQLVMRVHRYDPFRQDKAPYYANAFWDPYDKSMNFGDGDTYFFYPLVSLDVAAHEVSHGYTSYHADLAYHDQSGSLNESFSDMASIAARDYLYKRYNRLYQRMYGNNAPDWRLGTNIMRHGGALRYIDHPGRDGVSAECYQAVPGCNRNYQDVLDAAKKRYPQKRIRRQSYIVHTASGIFNRAFYILATTPQWDIEKAFRVMLFANKNHFWQEGGLDQMGNPTHGIPAYFEDAAMQTVAAAAILQYDTEAVKNAFQKVGLLLEKTQV